jgi:hypothetical protein
VYITETGYSNWKQFGVCTADKEDPKLFLLGGWTMICKAFFIAGVGALFRNTGIVAPAIFIFIISAAIMASYSGLPSAYTWLRPVKILASVVARDGFFIILLFSLICGVAAKSGKGYFFAALREPFVQLWGNRIRLAVFIGGVIFTLFILHPFRYYGFWDVCAAASIYGYLCSILQLRKECIRWGAEAGLICILLILVSYGFTVFKAAVFIWTEPHDAAVIAGEQALFGEALHRIVAGWCAAKQGFIEAADIIDL